MVTILVIGIRQVSWGARPLGSACGLVGGAVPLPLSVLPTPPPSTLLSLWLSPIICQKVRWDGIALHCVFVQPNEVSVLGQVLGNS